MKNLFKGLLATTTVLASLAVSTVAQAITVTPVSLRSDLLSTFQTYVQNERKPFTQVQLEQLDPQQFYQVNKSFDVFFINEGAGFRNQLFYNANQAGLSTVFNDVSSPNSIIPESNGPLKLGEGKKFTGYESGTSIEFFLKANGYNGGKYLYGADPTKNPDGLQHMVAYNYYDSVSQENYILVGFEDLYGELKASGGKNQGSDRDFNDTVFAFKGLSTKKVNVPEPTMIISLAVISLGLLTMNKKKSI